MEKETAFLEEISKVPPENLIFLDEAGAHLGMMRSNARSPAGERACCKRSASNQSNISMAGALSINGICELYPYDGPVNGERFLSYLDRLLPKLGPHNVVVMDNLRVHHIPAVREKFAKANVGLLYLPPYSPERNPIENAWSVIKSFLRATEAKTISEFVDAIKAAILLITSEMAQAFFLNAGYAPRK